MHALVTIGMSCSGKSTLAAEYVKKGYREINRDWIRFNVVKPGADWRNYKFTKANEAEVTDIHNKMIMESAENQENIIISNTNLNIAQYNTLVEHLKNLGYEVQTEVIEVTYEEALKRDAYRLNGVGHSIIYRQKLQMNKVLGRHTYTPDPNKPSVIIVDVDGTVAQMNGRGAFEWHRVGEDEPRQFVIDMVRNYYDQGYGVIIVSGRSDECRKETIDWLHLHDVPYDHIYMRKKGDFRKDTFVKEDILWEHIEPYCNVVACIDDRPMMIRLWHELKIPNVIAVADPYIEF